jgi:hypothetical protein
LVKYHYSASANDINYCKLVENFNEKQRQKAHKIVHQKQLGDVIKVLAQWVKLDIFFKYFHGARSQRSSLARFDHGLYSLDQLGPFKQKNSNYLLTPILLMPKLRLTLRKNFKGSRALVWIAPNLKRERQVGKPNLSLAPHQRELDEERRNDSIQKHRYIHFNCRKLFIFWLLAIDFKSNQSITNQQGVYK